MKNIAEDIKKGEYKRIYLLYGTENYLKRVYAGKLVKALFPDDEENMNLVRYTSETFDVNGFIGFADTMPFLAEKRLAVIDRSGLFKASKKEKSGPENDETDENESATSEKTSGNAREDLAAYFKHMPDTAVAVFIEDEADKRSRLYKAVKDNGYVCEMNRLNPDELRMWIAKYLKTFGKNITAATADLLQDYVGTDMEGLIREMEKLTAYIGDRTVVTDEDIEAICTKQINAVIFSLTDALATGNVKEALRVLDGLKARKEPIQRIYYMLVRHFAQLLVAREMMDENRSKNEIVEVLAAHPFAVQKLMDQARRFKAREIRSMLEYGVTLEEDWKSGKIAEKNVAEMFIMHRAILKN